MFADICRICCEGALGNPLTTYLLELSHWEAEYQLMLVSDVSLWSCVANKVFMEPGEVNSADLLISQSRHEYDTIW